MNRENVVVARETIVRRINGKAERSSAAYFWSGEVGMVSIEGETGDAARVNRNVRRRIAVTKVANGNRFLA